MLLLLLDILKRKSRLVWEGEMEIADCRAGQLLLYNSRLYNATLQELDGEEPKLPGTSLLDMSSMMMPGHRVCLVLLGLKRHYHE